MINLACMYMYMKHLLIQGLISLSSSFENSYNVPPTFCEKLSLSSIITEHI